MTFWKEHQKVIPLYYKQIKTSGFLWAQTNLRLIVWLWSNHRTAICPGVWTGGLLTANHLVCCQQTVQTQHALWYGVLLHMGGITNIYYLNHIYGLKGNMCCHPGCDFTGKIVFISTRRCDRNTSGSGAICPLSSTCLKWAVVVTG